MTGNPADAQDVVQDAMVRMLRYIDTFRGGNARTWVLSIVRNTALTWLQTNRRPGQVSLDDDSDGRSDVDALLLAHGEGGGDPAAIQLRRSEIEALHCAIREL